MRNRIPFPRMAPPVLLPLLLLLLAAGAALAQTPLPHGSVIDGGPIACPTGTDPNHDPTPPVPPGGSLSCHTITVSGCGPDATATVWIVKLAPTATLKGTIFLHGGGGGRQNFTSGGVEPSSYRHTLESDYESDGFQLVDIAWANTDWEFTDPPSTLAGACRPASVAAWIFNNPNLHDARRDIGFCAQGHSGGSAAMAYLLTDYGLKGYFDYVMLTAGPVFGRIDCGCDTALSTCGMQQLCPELPLTQMQNHLGYSADKLGWIDRNEGTATCGQNTGSNPGDPTWNQDSVVGPGADVSYPKTGVSVWQCVNYQNNTLNNAPAESWFFVNAVSQLAAGQHPQVFCSSTGCDWEAIYAATINGVPATTVMSQVMAAGCVPRH